MAKQNKKNNKMTRPNSLPLLHPWGVQSFFCFFCFLVFLFFLLFWFLVFWFVVVFLKGWQNNTKVKDLDLTLCQFSHFRGLQTCLWLFYCLLWVYGSIRKPCKKPWQNAGITGGSLGTQIRQFCLFM